MDIFELIACGNLEGIRAWVKDENMNKNVDRFGVTPLHHAVQLKNEKAAEIFVKNNLYIQSANWTNNTTPLHDAVYYDLANLVSLLIKRGAIVNIKNKFGQFPLHYAAWNGCCHAVFALIENGAEINVFDNDKETPLCYAICWSFKTAKTLLNEGASLLTNDNDGNHYLKLARGENFTLLLKHHVKLQKFVVCRKKLVLTSRVFLKFLNTFKILFSK